MDWRHSGPKRAARARVHIEEASIIYFLLAPFSASAPPSDLCMAARGKCMQISCIHTSHRRMKCVFFCACVQLKESWGERATAAVAAGSRREKLLCMCVCSFVREPLTKRRHKMKKGLFAPAQPEKHVHKTETHYPHFTMPPIHPPQHVRTTQPAQHATLHTQHAFHLALIPLR